MWYYIRRRLFDAKYFWDTFFSGEISTKLMLHPSKQTWMGGAQYWSLVYFNCILWYLYIFSVCGSLNPPMVPPQMSRFGCSWLFSHPNNISTNHNILSQKTNACQQAYINTPHRAHISRSDPQTHTHTHFYFYKHTRTSRVLFTPRLLRFPSTNCARLRLACKTCARPLMSVHLMFVCVHAACKQTVPPRKTLCVWWKGEERVRFQQQNTFRIWTCTKQAPHTSIFPIPRCIAFGRGPHGFATSPHTD